MYNIIDVRARILGYANHTNDASLVNAMNEIDAGLASDPSVSLSGLKLVKKLSAVPKGISELAQYQLKNDDPELAAKAMFDVYKQSIAALQHDGIDVRICLPGFGVEPRKVPVVEVTTPTPAPEVIKRVDLTPEHLQELYGKVSLITKPTGRMTPQESIDFVARRAAVIQADLECSENQATILAQYFNFRDARSKYYKEHESVARAIELFLANNGLQAELPKDLIAAISAVRFEDGSNIEWQGLLYEYRRRLSMMEAAGLNTKVLLTQDFVGQSVNTQPAAAEVPAPEAESTPEGTSEAPAPDGPMAAAFNKAGVVTSETTSSTESQPVIDAKPLTPKEEVRRQKLLQRKADGSINQKELTALRKLEERVTAASSQQPAVESTQPVAEDPTSRSSEAVNTIVEATENPQQAPQADETATKIQAQALRELSQINTLLETSDFQVLSGLPPAPDMNSSYETIFNYRDMLEEITNANGDEAAIKAAIAKYNNSGAE